MRQPFSRRLIYPLLFALLISAGRGAAEPLPTVRFGYLEETGSALILIAAANGLFPKEGVAVHAIPFRDSASGLAALATGKIDAGGFAVEETLRAIARGDQVRIIAGGGTDSTETILDEVDASVRQEREERGIVVAAGGRKGLDKETLVALATALIKADVMLQNRPSQAWGSIPGYRPGKERSFRFDPDPDYWRLSGIWQRHGLQRDGMPRDFLADRVYEEIYCDALEGLTQGDGEVDPTVKKLAQKAVCPPDCCPTGKKKRTTKGGSQ